MAKTDLRRVGKLLTICESFENCFTLQELVARVMQECPGEAFETAAVWRSLVNAKRVKICGDSPEPRFCVVKGHHASWRRT
jgi:hypothetical protein